MPNWSTLIRLPLESSAVGTLREWSGSQKLKIVSALKNLQEIWNIYASPIFRCFLLQFKKFISDGIDPWNFTKYLY